MAWGKQGPDMKYLIALVVIIAILAYILNRRGSSGLGGGTETDETALGLSHREGAGGGPGASAGGRARSRVDRAVPDGG